VMCGVGEGKRVVPMIRGCCKRREGPRKGAAEAIGRWSRAPSRCLKACSHRLADQDAHRPHLEVNIKCFSHGMIHSPIHIAHRCVHTATLPTRQNASPRIILAFFQHPPANRSSEKHHSTFSPRKPLRLYRNSDWQRLSSRPHLRAFSAQREMSTNNDADGHEPVDILLIGLGSIGAVYAHILERVSGTCCLQ